MRIHMTRGLVREALNLSSGESIDFFKLKHSDKDNRVSLDSNKPVWDKLNCQNIRLALQLPMQHFHITYPHRWSAPKLTIAIEYSLRDMHGEGIKYDYARYLIYELHRGKKSIESAQNSKAVCPHPMYLRGVLVLTRIVYFAMGKIDILPPPLHIPHGVIPKHSTRPQARERPAREPAPCKEMPKKSSLKEPLEVAKEWQKRPLKALHHHHHLLTKTTSNLKKNLLKPWR